MKRTPLKRKTRLKGQSSLKRTRLKRVSPERAKRERAKHKTYEKIDAAFSGRCDGCGRRKVCNHSHLVPESVRPDLVSDSTNIRFHCQERDKDQEHSCHTFYENNIRGVELLSDYKENLERIKELDYDYYLKFKSKHE